MVHQNFVTGKLYPDRSFSIGFVPKIAKKKAEKEYDRAYSLQEPTNELDVVNWLTGVDTIEGKFQSISESPLLVKGLKSSQKKRGSYGESGITKYGRRFCKNACILLEQRYGVRRLGFATATFPRMGGDTCEFVNGNISDIIRRFYQKIKRFFEKRGREFIYVGVVEIQEKRFGTSGLPVPHIHFVYVAKTGIRGRYIIDTKECYPMWNDAVNEVFELNGREKIMGKSGHKGSVKLEPVRTSAAAYLGKYISKGCKVVEAMKEKGFNRFPKQWWTACMRCKKLFKESVVCMDANLCKSFFYGLEHYLHEGIITWARFVEVEIAGEYRTMGLVGTISQDAYSAIVSAYSQVPTVVLSS